MKASNKFLTISIFRLVLIFGFPLTVNAAPLCQNIFESKTESFLESSDRLKVAAVPYPLSEKSDFNQMKEKIKTYVLAAKAQGAELVAFPELITTELVDWQSPKGETEQLEVIATSVTPQYFDFIQKLSVENKIAILGGSTPRKDGAKTVNTSVLALPDGRSFFQDKIFLTPDEKNWGWAEGENINVIEAPWGKTVIAICFDCEFPVISQLLSLKSPDVILVPSWTSTSAGYNRVDWASKARAVEHYAFVVKVGTIPDAKSTQPHFGNGSIIGPQDAALADATTIGTLNRSDIIYSDLNLLEMKTQRQKSGYFPAGEQKSRKKPIVVQMKSETIDTKEEVK